VQAYNEATEAAVYSHHPSEISHPSDDDVDISDDGDKPWDAGKKQSTKRQK